MNTPVTRLQQRPLPDPETCREWLTAMQRLRRFDERAGELHGAGQIGGFLHLAIGEEAAIVGAARALEDRDWLVGALVRGSEPAKVMAELLGRTAGLARGRGGALHAGDPDHRFLTGTGVDGGELPLAAGVALASGYQGRAEVTLCMTGAGATGRGVFDETLALAGAQRLPLVVVVVSNQFGLTDPAPTTAPSALTRRAEGAGIKALRGDGMEIVEAHEVCADAVRIARTERRPVLVELLTHRTRERSLADPKPYRGREALAEWKQRDPIVRFGDRLVEVGLLESSERARIQMAAQTLVEQAVSAASRAPQPDPETLRDGLYVATGLAGDAEATR